MLASIAECGRPECGHSLTIATGQGGQLRLRAQAAGGRRQAQLKALGTERTRVEGAVRNMFDFIEQGIVRPRNTDFIARLAVQRNRRTDL